MLIVAGGHARVFSLSLVIIGMLVLVAFVVVVGIHLFLAGVGHYAPWEQIWAG